MLPEREACDDNSQQDSSDGSKTAAPPKRKRVLFYRVSAVLDRTYSSVKKSSMVMAFILDEAGLSTSVIMFSESS